ncbi:hypothetical protein AX15_001685 [Amanita polypyramis BW_CC]|nr:hypothetical protein AX15_001685 [Amanita polypyramis BW_CC]
MSESKVLELTSDEEDESQVNRNLYDDLEEALNEDKLDPSASYAHSSLLPLGPHPCLSVDGLGTIGLPLSELDAKRIIGNTSQARALHGEDGRIIINEKVRGGWEIDATHVTLENPFWQGFVQGLALSACRNLGVPNYDRLPRCKLYKLLLYETGSCFPPCKDSQKEKGMFATMIVLLPSWYTGGEVHLTHASRTHVIDFSAPSFTDMAVLAWYMDILHEMKPVKSGYRLALSYNIIHTSRSMPLPAVPTNKSIITELKRILHKWREEKYSKPEHLDYVGYLTWEQYSEEELKKGAASMEGEDAQRVAFLRAATEELEFEVCFANIEYHVTGYIDEDEDSLDYRWRKRRERDLPSTWISHGKRVNVILSNMVNLKGDRMLGAADTMRIGEQNLIPRHALDDDEPDDEIDPGYSSDYEELKPEGTKLEYWYYRSVIILIPTRVLYQVLIDNGGTEYVVEQFKASLSENPPTAKDIETATLVVKNIRRDETRSLITILFEYSFKWKVIEIWKGITKYTDQDIREDKFVRAIRVFGFDHVRSSIESFLQTKRLPYRRKCLRDQLKLINVLGQVDLDQSEKVKVQAWCPNQVALALMHASPDAEDIHIFVSMARENGIQSVQPLQFAEMDSEKGFQFLTEFVSALHSNRNDILSQTTVRCQSGNGGQSQIQATSLLDDFIRLSLSTIAKQWRSVGAEPKQFYPQLRQVAPDANQPQVKRILKIVELCITTHQMEACRAFLDIIWSGSGDVARKYDLIYTPLIPDLCELLQKLGIDTCSPPFANFFRLLISYYLHYVLGTRSHNPGPAFRRFNRVANWECRLQVVQSFFKMIGTKNVEKIMGDRYADAQEALRGVHAFQLDSPTERQRGVVAGASAPSTYTTAVAGGKRKYSEASFHDNRII